MSKEKSLPFKYQFLAGAIAGVSEISIMYPLDVVKTRFQLPPSSIPKPYKGIFDCFSRIIKEEGPQRLYRGIAAPVMVEAPKRATKFACQQEYTKLILSLLGKEKTNQSIAIATGIASGSTEAFVVCSMELVKIRMQDNTKGLLYSNTFDCIRKIWKMEGPAAFFKGLEATIWRHSFWNGGYFGTIFGIKERLSSISSFDDLPLLSNFVAGSIGGIFGTILNCPFDVIKTRIQSQLPSTKSPPLYNWALPSLVSIAKQEGFFSLYRGFLPKVLRLGPGGGILLVVFDAVSKVLKEYC